MYTESESQSKSSDLEDTPVRAFESVRRILYSASSDHPLLPPTVLYNEGWLLRLVLDWFSRHSVEDHPLSFAPSAAWFSEALLPSAFLARHRGDRLAESWTHADGVIGHFAIGQSGKADLNLLPGATQFLVLEAKMFSALSVGVSRAGYYDQAARNVACMAEVLRRAGRHPSEMSKLGFYVLAPLSQIEKGFFTKALTKESIFRKVARRVEAFERDKDEWFSEWSRPTRDLIDIQCLSWEGTIAYIEEHDPPTGKSIALFYDYCPQFNQ